MFGQTYVRTDKIPKLFDEALTYPNTGNLAASNMKWLANGTSDQNAKFIFSRMHSEDWNKWNRAFPYPSWRNEVDDITGPVNTLPDSRLHSRQDKAYVEKGAEAFMAVGGDVTLPPTATQIRVRVEFNNTSPARNDSNPSSKEWSSPEIYASLYRINPGGSPTSKLAADAVPRPYFKYGPPRCGITKMKLVMLPNADLASTKHVTFAIPDPQFTIAGVARDLALQPVWDSSTYKQFTYRVIIPEEGMVSPEALILSVTAEDVQRAQDAYDKSLSDDNDLGDFNSSGKADSEISAEEEIEEEQSEVVPDEVDEIEEANEAVKPVETVKAEDPPKAKKPFLRKKLKTLAKKASAKKSR